MRFSVGRDDPARRSSARRGAQCASEPFSNPRRHTTEHPDHLRGCAGLVLTCKEHLLHYYAKFGSANEGVSHSTHGGAV